MAQQEVPSVNRATPTGRHQQRTNNGQHRVDRHSNVHKSNNPWNRRQIQGHSRDGKKHPNGSTQKSEQSECGRYAKNHEVEALPDAGNSDSNDEYFIDSIKTPYDANQAFYTLCVGPKNIPVRFKLDTGSQANTLPNSLFETLGCQGRLKPSSEKLSSYSGHALDTLGICQLQCSHKGAKYFSKLDAKSGYWNIKLDEESSLHTTFNTPFGRYRNLRLPFGPKSSQDEFQQKMDECYEGLEGTVALVDDVLVYGKTRSEHDKNLHEAFVRSRERGIKLNRDKLEVGLTRVKYFGHTLTAEGLEPDEDKIRAVQLMKPPTTKGELETFLGMVTYLSQFAPNLSEVTSPIRILLTQNVEFHWDKPQADAFHSGKDIITASPVLAYFDSNKEVTLQTDATKFGLGATVMQEGKPIAFASKSLTPSEINYAQIEKEMYAIVFGCTKFHQYLYGRKVRVETDHKPLIPISQKSLYAAPPRLQRHMGIEKCLKRARCSVFWPKLNADIAELVSQCPVCVKHSYCNAKEPLKPHPIPVYPWQVVATDLFECDNKDYIVVVDYYSCYFEVAHLHSTTSRAVINELKPIFSRFGIPEKVVSDNGPHYSSQEFVEFSRQYDFVHVTSSPRYPQSNGLAEKYAQIAKRILKKAKYDSRDPYLGMLEYRTTPL
ncbi:uncharacterized protein K02A2.6-like [Pecten maximus]|uniref:uncharacterized protein K02A2.6-like n=1 Tax=Pecten maximus TaxID=6579 RepID=UPI001458CB82|nr:uncharacterized protein K02A2.6-like [Pecten maximus]